MRILDVKLVCDLARLWAQALVISLVLAAGVAVLVLAIGAQRSLHETREAYYKRNRFGEIFATVTRAPKQLLPEIEARARARRSSCPSPVSSPSTSARVPTWMPTPSPGSCAGRAR